MRVVLCGCDSSSFKVVAVVVAVVAVHYSDNYSVIIVIVNHIQRGNSQGSFKSVLHYIHKNTMGYQTRRQLKLTLLSSCHLFMYRHS
jgi:hypothetical protein